MGKHRMDACLSNFFSFMFYILPMLSITYLLSFFDGPVVGLIPY